jgi:hypothetical protein
MRTSDIAAVGAGVERRLQIHRPAAQSVIRNSWAGRSSSGVEFVDELVLALTVRTDTPILVEYAACGIGLPAPRPQLSV